MTKPPAPTPFEQGFDSAKAGLDCQSCPYPISERNGKLWILGWRHYHDIPPNRPTKRLPGRSKKRSGSGKKGNRTGIISGKLT